MSETGNDIPDSYQAGDLGCEECGAQPGERCGPFCTSYDGTDEATSADMVRVADDAYAVRFCPRCGGTGHDRGKPNSAWTWPSTTDASAPARSQAGEQDDAWCRCVRDEEEAIALHLAEVTAPTSASLPDSNSRPGSQPHGDGNTPA